MFSSNEVVGWICFVLFGEDEEEDFDRCVFRFISGCVSCLVRLGYSRVVLNRVMSSSVILCLYWLVVII